MTLYAMPYRRIASADRTQATRKLPMNVRDDGEAFVLTAQVPGLKADDLKIQVLDDVVHIEGEFAADDNEYLLHELSGGSFSRKLGLPAPVETDKVEAKIEDGMLTLRLPKSESARPRTIRVTVN